MLRYVALGLSAVSALIVACSAERPSNETTSAAVHAETFVGVLHCADCAGIRNELTLYTEQPSGKPTKYQLTETYLGTREGDRAFSHEGKWTVLRGSATDPDATVYQLEYDNSARTRNFRKVNDDELRLLDLEQREIPSPAPHSLHRVAGGSQAVPDQAR